MLDISINHDQTFLGIFPKVEFKDKGSYEESGTKEFDRMAFKYLGTALFPLAIGYCIYSVIYNEHKGWYSFLLSSCYGFLLTFGIETLLKLHELKTLKYFFSLLRFHHDDSPAVHQLQA